MLSRHSSVPAPLAHTFDRHNLLQAVTFDQQLLFLGLVLLGTDQGSRDCWQALRQWRELSS